jgi:hypothetical protein
MKWIVEPQKRIPVIDEPDVLVVGGGAAGIAAACASARAGARTLLVERFGFLGGTLTAVTLGGLCGIHAVIDDARIGRVVGGLCLDLEDRLRHCDAILAPKRHGRIVGVPYDCEALKRVTDEIIRAAGVRTLLHGQSVGAQVEAGRITSVFLETREGRVAVRPQMVIDCSGDGDLAAAAGAQFRLGENGRTQYGSTMFRLGNVDTQVAGALSRADIRDCLERAVSDGYELPRTATGVHVSPVPGVVHLNVTRLQKADGEPFDFTRSLDIDAAEVEGRRQVFLYETVFRRYVPGFERARVIDIGALVGIRETRLIEGLETLTEAAVRQCEKPSDRIACTAWPLEHHGAGRGTQWEFLPDGDWYGIAYGCLVVKGFDNLFVAGRNLSATHIAQASARVAGPCFAMGEAAGSAAAMACAAGRVAAAVDVPQLQAALERNGAILNPALTG